MRILFLGAADSIHMYKWVRWFEAHGVETSWISMTPSAFPDMGATRFAAPDAGLPTPLKYASAIRTARMWVRDLRPDLVHAHYLGAYGLIGAASGGRPLVATAWGSDVLLGRKSPLKRPFVRHVIARADLITTDAQHMIDAMRELGGAKEKMHVIFFGIDTDRFRPAPASPELRQRWGAADPATPVVISLRSLAPIYDIGTLVRAVPAIRAQAPSVRIVIVGGGPSERELRDLASALGVSDSIIWAGRIPNTELPAYLNAADVYVSTSLSDAGIAASTAEAMSCERPVVISDSAENGEWVTSGSNGWLFRTGDSAELASVVWRAIASPDDRQRVGRAARTTITARNSIDGEMTKVMRLYEQVLRQTVGRP